jgi:hypothetical protein
MSVTKNRIETKMEVIKRLQEIEYYLRTEL